MRIALAALAIATLAGCQQADEIVTAPVKGTITLDGKPLPNARVVFAPLGERGGPAYAVSNNQGEYELHYTHEKKGAVVGSCLVRINTATRPTDGDDLPPTLELVPAKYNVESTLHVEVAPEKDSYDFALVSE
jgi:hypothetical protein